jgi:hypothetical protein
MVLADKMDRDVTPLIRPSILSARTIFRCLEIIVYYSRNVTPLIRPSILSAKTIFRCLDMVLADKMDGLIRGVTSLE